MLSAIQLKYVSSVWKRDRGLGAMEVPEGASAMVRHGIRIASLTVPKP